MKSRDVLLVGLLIVVVALWLQPATQVTEGPTAQRPAIKTVVDVVAIWWLMRREASPPAVQELPDRVVNAPAARLSGPDGHALLDHGSGW